MLEITEINVKNNKDYEMATLELIMSLRNHSSNLFLLTEILSEKLAQGLLLSNDVFRKMVDLNNDISEKLQNFVDHLESL